jgi:uncharacterized protein YndB with AHSA1/START domain
VMKHLAVLERSGLVLVRREGRERWNMLAAGPGLTLAFGEDRRKTVALDAPTSATPGVFVPAGPATGAAAPFEIRLVTMLDAAAGRVFDALTFNVGAWWGAPYLRSAAATNVVLEPQLGGRLLEEWGHRQGMIRGVVTAIRQDERLEITGRIAGDGPLPAVLEFVLDHHQRGTRLTMSHRGVATAPRADARTPEPAVLYEGAWQALVGTRLKTFVEHGTRTGIIEQPPSPDAVYGWF